MIIEITETSIVTEKIDDKASLNLNLDFKNYHPKVFTIEHNHTDYEKKIDELMKLNGYTRIFKNLTLFDAWYVSQEIMDKFI